MNMKKLKALVGNRQGFLSCVDFDLSVKAIDFNAMKKAEKRSDYGIECWGEPALKIENGIATIQVRGLLVPNVGIDVISYGITGYDVIEHYINYANEQASVNRIVLDIDSGGGYVTGVYQCSEAISNSLKPISTFVSGSMCSGAYWLGCSAEEVVASKYAEVGSIGVYVEHFDYSRQLENEGVLVNLFKVGKWKGAFSPYRPLSEEEKAKLQSEIDEIAEQFFTHVAENRNLSKKEVAKLEADVFSAEDAIKLGLIDRINNVKTEEGNTMNKDVKGEQAQPLTTAQIEEIKAQAKAEAQAQFQAEMQAKAERVKAIYALETTDEVKAVLSSDKFANVDLDGMKELLAVMPKSFVQAMDETGGAGVEASPMGFAGLTAEEIKAQKQANSESQLKNLAYKGL